MPCFHLLHLVPDACLHVKNQVHRIGHAVKIKAMEPDLADRYLHRDCRRSEADDQMAIE